MSESAAPLLGPGSPTYRLNHINLCATDVTALGDIFTRHFAFELLQTGKVPLTGAAFVLLRGTDGFFLVLTSIGPDAPAGPDSPRQYPADFHVGFMVDSPDKVLSKHRELTASGLHPRPIKQFNAMGSAWTAFYCPVGDGIEIEVNAHV